MLPFEVRDLRAAGLEAILRVIREQEPPKPSTRIRSNGPASAESAEQRKEEPRLFARHLQGELDWITMKALEKDRNRRYGSPAELGADIERHLHNEPVLAYPPSPGYRAGRFARRHRFGVVAAASAMVLLIGFAAAMAVQARRIAIERDRANRQADVAERVVDFMKGMFAVSDPSNARGNSITAREILDKGSREIDKGLAKDPETQAQLMDVMGEVYESLGLYAQAQPLLERAVDIQRGVHGPRNPETLTSSDEMAWLLFHETHYTQAEKLGRETLNIRRQVLGPEHPEVLTSMRHLASTLDQEGRYPEAERMQRDLLQLDRRVLGGEDPETLKTINNLTAILQRAGHYAEAEAMQREAVAIERRVLGPEHPDTLRTTGNLIGTLVEEGRYAEAERMQRELLGIERRVLGPEHQDVAGSNYNLGCLAALQGRRNEAFSLLREAVDHGLYPYADLGIETDSDLKSLHGDPRFAALVADAKEKAAAAKKPH